ncbi:MAG: ATP-binding protein [Nitrospirota bacterium]|jgi:signal transduction histidine kinase
MTALLGVIAAGALFARELPWANAALFGASEAPLRFPLSTGVMAAFTALLALGRKPGEGDSEESPPSEEESSRVPAGRDLDSLGNLEKMFTLGELAGAIAHEIKNPLAGISGAIQVIADDLPAGDRRREVFRDILKEIDRLDKSVRNLLGFARPPEPHLVIAPLGDVIHSVGELLAGQAKKQSVDVTILLGGGPEKVLMDPEQMRQALLNVAMNALHAMPGGGTLTMTARGREEDGAVEIAVADTGKGIEREEVGKLFVPFYTTKPGGSGLGLAITKGIVEKHGGEVTVQSRVGEGTTVRITLPVREENA